MAALKAAAEQLSALLEKRDSTLTSTRRGLLRCLLDISATCRVLTPSQVLPEQPALEATLRTLLGTSLPLFTHTVVDTLVEAHIALFNAGDCRTVRASCDFLLKQVVGRAGSGGVHSSRTAGVVLLGALHAAFGASLAEDAAETCTALMRIVSGGGTGLTGAAFRAAACTAVYRVLDGLGSRLLPAGATAVPSASSAPSGAGGAGAPAASSATSRLHASALAHAVAISRDASPAVRACAGPTLQALATGSAGFRTIAVQDLLRAAIDGVCDPHPVPRLASALALSSVLSTSVIASRVGAVAAEATAVALRAAAMRGTGESDGEEEGEEGEGGAADGAGAELGEDGGEVGGDGAHGSAGAAPVGSTPVFLQQMKKFSATVKKAAVAAGKQMEVGVARKPEAADGAASANAFGGAGRAAFAAEAAAASVGSTSTAGSSILRAIAQVAAVGGSRARPGTASFTAATAVAYVCGLMRAAGKLAVRTGTRAGDVRAALSIACAALLKSVQGSAGGTGMDECSAVVAAALQALREGDVAGAEAGSAPILSDVTVATGALPPSGAHASHMRACVLHVLRAGLVTPPRLPGSYAHGAWLLWQCNVSTMLLGLARGSIASGRATVERSSAGPPSTPAASRSLAKAGSFRVPGSGGLKRLASKLSFRTPRGKAADGAASAKASADAAPASQPLSDSALTVLLSLEAEIILSLSSMGEAERAAEEAEELSQLSLQIVTGTDGPSSYALRAAAGDALAVCSRVVPALLSASVQELLASIASMQAELTLSSSGRSASAAGSALADAHALAARRKGTARAAGPGRNSVPTMMLHSGATPVTACAAGFGIPGAGAGSGCGLASGRDAVLLTAMQASAMALASLLGASASGPSEVPVSPELLDACLSRATLLLCWTDADEGLAKGVLHASQGQMQPGSLGATATPLAALAQCAGASATAEVRAAAACAGYALLAGLASLSPLCLTFAHRWPVVFSLLARGMLRGYSALCAEGVGSARDGQGAFLFSPLGVPSAVSTVTALLTSSSTAHSGLEANGASAGAGANSLADAAGVGTARSLYSGVAGAWAAVEFAAASAGLRAVVTAVSSVFEASDAGALLAHLLQLGLTSLTASPLVPPALASTLRSAPDRTRSRLLNDAAAALQVRPDSAAWISLGPDAGDPSLALPAGSSVSVRGLVYQWEDGHLYTPTGVSIAAVALARSSAVEAASHLVAASAALPLHAKSCHPLRGALLSASTSLLTGGVAAFVPLEAGMLGMTDDGVQRQAAVAGRDDRLPVLAPGEVIGETHATAHAAAVLGAIGVLTSRPDDDTWSPLALSLAHAQPEEAAFFPRAQGCGDILHVVARICSESGIGSSPFSEEGLRAIFYPAATADSGHALSDCQRRWRVLLAPLGAKSAAAMDRTAFDSSSEVSAAVVDGQPAAWAFDEEQRGNGVTAGCRAFASLIPLLPPGQAQIAVSVLVAALRPPLDVDNDGSPTIGFRLASNEASTPSDRARLCRNGAHAILQLLCPLRPEQVAVEGGSPVLFADDDEAIQGAHAGLAAPVAWLASLRTPLTQCISSSDSVVRVLGASSLAELVRLSGPLFGRKLVLSVQKSMKALRSDVVTAATSASHPDAAGAVSEAAMLSTSGACLALALMHRAAALSTSRADVLSAAVRRGAEAGEIDAVRSRNLLALLPRVPLSLVSGALDEQLMFECARETRQPARTAVLAAWTTLVDTASAQLALLTRFEADDSGARWSEAVDSFRRLVQPSLALIEAHTMTSVSPHDPLSLLGHAGSGLGKDSFTTMLQAGSDGASRAARSSRTHLQAFVKLNADGEASLSLFDSSSGSIPASAAFLGHGLACHAGWLPGGGAVVTEGDLRLPSTCSAIDSVIAAGGVALPSASVLPVVHPCTGELLLPSHIIAAAELAAGAKSRRRGLTRLGALTKPGSSPLAPSASPLPSSPSSPGPGSESPRDSHTAAVLHAFRHAASAASSRLGQAAARALVASVAAVLQGGGTCAIDAQGSQLSPDAACEAGVATLLCAMLRSLCKGLSVTAPSWEEAQEGGHSEPFMPIFAKCSAAIALLAALASDGAASLMLAEASGYLSEAAGGLARSDDSSAAALIAGTVQTAVSRALCIGPGRVFTRAATVAPLPEVLGGMLGGAALPNPLPALISTLPSSSHPLAGLWATSAERLGVRWGSVSGKLVRHYAGSDERQSSLTSVRGGLTAGLVPCGIAHAAGAGDTSSVPSPQAQALATETLRAAGRPFEDTLATSASEGAAASSPLVAALYGSEASRCRSLAVSSLLRSWLRAMRGGGEGSPGYVVTLGCIGDVLLAVDTGGASLDDSAALCASMTAAAAFLAPARLCDLRASLCDAITEERSVSEANAAGFRAAKEAAAAAATKAAAAAAKRAAAGEGGDFGTSTSGAEAEVEDEGEGAASASLDPAIASLDTDALRIAAAGATAVVWHDNSLWRACGPTGKALAAAALSSLLTVSLPAPATFSPGTAAQLLRAACVALSVGGARNEGEGEGEGEGGRPEGGHSSSLRLEGARLLLATVRATAGLRDPDVPTAHALAQFSASLSAALLPAVGPGTPLDLLEVAVTALVLCVEGGLLSDEGSVRRAVAALACGMPSQTVASLSGAELLRLAALSRLLAIAAHQQEGGTALFERAPPAFLKEYAAALTLQSVPAPFTPPLSATSLPLPAAPHPTVRLSLAARDSVWANVQPSAVMAVVDALTLHGSDAIVVTHASVLRSALCALATASRPTALFAPVTRAQAGTAGPTPAALSPALLATAIQLCVVARDASALPALLLSPGGRGRLGACGRAAEAMCTGPAWSYLTARATQHEAPATPLRAIEELAVALGQPTAPSSTDALLLAVRGAARTRRGMPAAASAALAVLARTAAADGGEPWALVAARLAMAACAVSDGEAVDVRIPPALSSLRSLLSAHSPSLLAALGVACEQAGNSASVARIWMHVVWPIALDTPALRSACAVELNAALLRAGAALQATRLSASATGTAQAAVGALRAVISPCGAAAAVSVAASLPVDAAMGVLRAATHTLQVLLACASLVTEALGSARSVLASDLAAAAGEAILHLSTEAVAPPSPALFVGALKEVAPLLHPGQQTDGGFGSSDSGWVTAEAQRSVANSAVAVARRAGSAFREGLASLSATEQTALQAAVRSGVNGARRPTACAPAPAEVAAAVARQPQQQISDQQIVEQAAPRAPRLGGAGGGLKFNTASFAKAATATQAPRAPAVDLLASDDAFTVALRARAAGKSVRGVQADAGQAAEAAAGEEEDE